MNLFCTYHTLFQDPQTTSLKLGEVMEPDPIAFSFNTIGWKLLFTVIIILCFYGIYRFLQKYKNNQYRRNAISELKGLYTNKQLTEVSFIIKSFFIIKQTALQTYSREQVASLNGDLWLQFLDKQVSGTNFSKYKSDIRNAIYKETSVSKNFKKEDFFNMSLKWIKHHA